MYGTNVIESLDLLSPSFFQLHRLVSSNLFSKITWQSRSFPQSRRPTSIHVLFLIMDFIYVQWPATIRYHRCFITSFFETLKRYSSVLSRDTVSVGFLWLNLFAGSSSLSLSNDPPSSHPLFDIKNVVFHPCCCRLPRFPPESWRVLSSFSLPSLHCRN